MQFVLRGLAAGLLATAITVATPAIHFAQQSVTVPGASAPAPSDADLERPMFKVNDKVFTEADLRRRLELSKPLTYESMKNQEILALRGTGLLRLAQTLGLEMKLGAEGKAAKLPLNPLDERILAERMKRRGRMLIYETEVKTRVPQPTEEDLRKRYDELRDTRYSVVEEYTFRAIYLGTYKKYTVKDGDTLESIAAAEAGDAALAKRLVSDETKRPRWESLDPVPLAQGEAPPTPVPGATPIPPRALTAGEVLLVPMKAEEKEAVRARAKEAYEALQGGESFDTVAQRFSEAETGGVVQSFKPATDRPLLAEVLATLQKLKDGETSEPFETRHGFHIVRLNTYVPAEILPFEDSRVQTDLRNGFRQLAEGDTLRAYFNEQFAKHRSIINIDKEQLRKPESERGEMDIVVTVGDQEVLRRDFMNSWRRARPAAGLSPDTATDEQLEAALPEMDAIRIAIVDQRATDPEFQKRPEMVSYREMLELLPYVRERIAQRVKEEIPDPSDDLLRDRYQKEAAKHVAIDSIKFHRVYVPAPTEPEAVSKLLTELKEAFAKVETVEDFKTLAKKYAPTDEARSAVDVVNGPFASREADMPLRNALRAGNGQESGLIEPYIDGQNIALVWLLERLPKRTLPFEEVRQRILDEYRAEMADRWRNDYVVNNFSSVPAEVFPPYDKRESPAPGGS